jgi:hypothetical protein
VGSCLGRVVEFVKVVVTDKSWCDKFVYECLGNVRQFMLLCPSCKSIR